MFQSVDDEATGFMLGLRSANVLLQSLNESVGDWLQIFSEENIGSTVHLIIFNHKSETFIEQEGEINKLYKTISKKPSTNILMCSC